MSRTSPEVPQGDVGARAAPSRSTSVISDRRVSRLWPWLLRPSGAGPQRVVGVVRKIEMLRAEARVNQRKFAGFWIVHRELPARLIQRRHLRGRKTGTSFAVVRVRSRTDPRSEPHAPALIENRVMNCGVAIPDLLVTPIRRVP